ncbi:hypothetical protein ACM66B_000151 [Microbotryomycetes sp. NB124-2]
MSLVDLALSCVTSASKPSFLSFSRQPKIPSVSVRPSWSFNSFTDLGRGDSSRMPTAQTAFSPDRWRNASPSVVRSVDGSHLQRPSSEATLPPPRPPSAELLRLDPLSPTSARLPPRTGTFDSANTESTRRLRSEDLASPANTPQEASPSHEASPDTSIDSENRVDHQFNNRQVANGPGNEPDSGHSSSSSDNDAHSLSSGPHEQRSQRPISILNANEQTATRLDEHERVFEKLGGTLDAITQRLVAASTVNQSKPSGNNVKTKLRAPDRFSGKDPRKLRIFLAQLRMDFLGSGSSFENDHDKCIYAGNHMEDIAFDWFQNTLANDNENWILDDYDAFQEELKRQFGDPNERATAERSLRVLRMTDNQEVTRYVDEFKRLRAHCRILDELARRDEDFDDLVRLQRVCICIDQRHWERHRARSNASSNNWRSSSNKPRHFTWSFSDKPQQDRPPLPLGPDGKLLPEERQRRKKLGLCAYHGVKHPDGRCPREPTRSFEPSPRPGLNSSPTVAAAKFASHAPEAVSKPVFFSYASKSNTPEPLPAAAALKATLSSSSDSAFISDSKVGADASSLLFQDECIIPVHVNDIPVQALVDCGATISSINERLVHKHKLQRRSLARPITITAFGGQQIRVTHYVGAPVKFADHCRHDMHLHVAPLGLHDVIFGNHMLRTVNPVINWTTGATTFPH